MQITPGLAELSLSRHHHRTLAHHQYSRAPLQWLGPLPSPHSALLYYLRNPNGGLLHGDRHQIHLELGSATELEICSQGATRIHPGEAQQLTQITLQANSTLIWIPHPLIPGADSRFQQQLIVEMDSSARLAYGEIWTAGRIGMGECWQFQQLSNELQIWLPGDPHPLLWERMDLQAPHDRLQTPGVLGSWTCWGSLYLLGAWDAVEWTPSEIRWSVSIDDPRCSGEILRQVGDQALGIWSVFRDTLRKMVG